MWDVKLLGGGPVIDGASVKGTTFCRIVATGLATRLIRRTGLRLLETSLEREILFIEKLLFCPVFYSVLYLSV